MHKKGKVIALNPRYIEEALDILVGMSEEDIRNITKYLSVRFLEEIKQGIEGELSKEEAPFFTLVDKMYEDAATQLKGCYFCDPDIDGNEISFNPDVNKVCLSCQIKIANLLKAFDIDHQVLFPGMGERKIQKVIFRELKATDKLGYH